jgi:hypothetical protein
VKEKSLQIGVLTVGCQKTVCLGLSIEMLAELGRGKVQVIRGQDINLHHPMDILLIGAKSPRSVQSKLIRFGHGLMKSFGHFGDGELWYEVRYGATAATDSGRARWP